MRAAADKDDHVFVVLDDDPTGVQCVHDVRVLMEVDEAALNRVLNQEKLFFLLTNSRALRADASASLHRRITSMVHCAAEKGIEITAIPGACAMACAISISGIESRQFTFLGFPPRENKALRSFFMDALDRYEVIVMHESPHRVLNLLRMMNELLPACQVSVSCDLTKLHETTVRGDIQSILLQAETNTRLELGEYIIVADLRTVSRDSSEAEQPISIEARLMEHLTSGETMRSAMEAVIRAGERKNAVYQASLKLRDIAESLTGKGRGSEP